jgi:hypothetical protein
MDTLTITPELFEAMKAASFTPDQILSSDQRLYDLRTSTGITYYCDRYPDDYQRALLVTGKPGTLNTMLVIRYHDTSELQPLLDLMAQI